MTLSLGGAVNSAAGWACNAPFVRTVVNNPLFTALLVSALVVVILFALCRGTFGRESKKGMLRAFIYILLATTVVLFIHHKAVVDCERGAARMQGTREVFSSIQSSQELGGYDPVPIVPREKYEDPFPQERAEMGYHEPYAPPYRADRPPRYEGGDEDLYAYMRPARRMHPHAEHAGREDNVSMGAGALDIPDVRLPWSSRGEHRR